MKAKKNECDWRNELYESLDAIRRIERQMAEHQSFPQVVGSGKVIRWPLSVVNCHSCGELIFDVDHAIQSNGLYFHDTICQETYYLEREQ